jgi:hypothetical protein
MGPTERGEGGGYKSRVVLKQMLIEATFSTHDANFYI